MDVAIGDIVHFTKYSPDEIELGSMGSTKKYLVIKHSAVLAIEK